METLQLHSVYKLSEVILQQKSYKGYGYHPPCTSKAFTCCSNIPILRTAQFTYSTTKGYIYSENSRWIFFPV